MAVIDGLPVECWLAAILLTIVVVGLAYGVGEGTKGIDAVRRRKDEEERMDDGQ